MRSYTEYLKITSNKEKEILNITSEVEKVLRESGIKEGLCLVNSMHITSSVFINDDESGLHKDFMKWLEQIAPEKPDYQHHQTGETNADAHLKRTLM